MASLSADLGVSDQTIYNWRRQDAVDRSLEPGLTSSEKEELRAARRRIAELETELAVTRRANELLKAQVVTAGNGSKRSRRREARGLPTQVACRVACRVLGVSVSGFYAWRTRPPLARAIRHTWLTDLIHQIHQQSRGTYGALGVHAELRLGYGITVAHNAVAMLIRRAGLAGLSGSRGRRRLIRPLDTPADLVDRNFVRREPDRLWVTDVERHEALINRAVVGGHRLVLVASGHVEAEGSLNLLERGVWVDSSLDNDGTDQYCQMVRVRLARQKGVREEPATESSSSYPAARTWRIRGRAATRTRTAMLGGELLGWSMSPVGRPR